MSNKLNYIITSKEIVVVIDNKPIVVPNTNSAYDLVKEAICTKDMSAIKKALDKATAIMEHMGESVEVLHGQVYYKGKMLHSTLVNRIIEHVDSGTDATPLTNFLENLMLNPSSSSVNELYDFLEAGKFPITDDGCFLAWKKVTDAYKDCHSNTFDNSVGKILEMPRNEVDDNRNQTCSRGFHIASYGYAKAFQSGKMMIVKINPRDVVSVPSDHNNEKCRVSRYEVVYEVPDAQDILNFGFTSDKLGVTRKKKQAKTKPKKKPNYHSKRGKGGRFVKKKKGWF